MTEQEQEGEYKPSLFEKMLPVLDDYMLAKLKIEQLSKGDKNPGEWPLVAHRSAYTIANMIRENENK